MPSHTFRGHQDSFRFNLNKPLALPAHPEQLPPTITVWFALPDDKIRHLENCGVPRIRSVTQSMNARRGFMRPRLGRGKAFADVRLGGLCSHFFLSDYRLVHAMLVLLKKGGRRDCLVLTYEKSRSAAEVVTSVKSAADAIFALGGYRSLEVEVCQGGFTLYPEQPVFGIEANRFAPLRLISGDGPDTLTTF